jgi:hypothetical protein
VEFLLFDTARVRFKLHLFSGATGHRRRCGLQKTLLEDFGGSEFRTTVCDWIPHAAVQYQVYQRKSVGSNIVGRKKRWIVLWNVEESGF